MNPQHGCNGLGLKDGGVGFHAPAPGAGTYAQLSKVENPSVEAQSRIAAATARPCATERSYTFRETRSANCEAWLCSRPLMASREA